MGLKKKEVKDALIEGLNEAFDDKNEIPRDSVHQILASVCERVLSEAVYLMTIDEEVFFRYQQVLFAFGDIVESLDFLKKFGYRDKYDDIKAMVLELHGDGYRGDEIVTEIIKRRDYDMSMESITDIVNEILEKEVK